MNARQFFDVWMTACERVSSARAGWIRPATAVTIIRTEIGIRHGPEIAERAVLYFERLLRDTQTGGSK